MFRSSNIFSALMDRVQVGDKTAQLELRQKLEPEMVFIVRHVIEKGVGHSPMDRRILAEARRLGVHAGMIATTDGEALIRQIAECVSGLFIAGLQRKAAAPRYAADTIRA
ncbi:MAG: hypothetical protein FJ303_16210 [Planctomycetes bacterium]|nr:hypothetical protein [Planctomycetota bacterium]